MDLISKTHHWVKLLFFHEDGMVTRVPLKPNEPFEAGVVDVKDIAVVQSVWNIRRHIVFNKILRNFRDVIGKVVRFELISEDESLPAFRLKAEIMASEDYVPYAPRPLKPSKIIFISGNENTQPVIPQRPMFDHANYVELTGVTELIQGDILPGGNFVLGEDETYNRELLTVNFRPESAVYNILVEAKRIGSEGRSAGRSVVEIADRVARLVENNFAQSSSDAIQRNGASQTIGDFYQNGGVCRHKAALLQMALQEAGVKSRYVRGVLAGGGPHAWVEVDTAGNNSYTYLIDIHLGVVGKKQGFRFTSNGNLLFGVEGCSQSAYVVDVQKTNVVWRLRSLIQGTQPQSTATEPRPANPPPPPPPNYSAPDAPPPSGSQAQAVNTEAPHSKWKGYAGPVKAPPPKGEILNIPKSACSENIPIDLMREVEPIDLMRRIDADPQIPEPVNIFDPQSVMEPESAPQQVAEPSPSPLPERGAFVKIGLREISLKRQANLWTGEIKGPKTIRFGYGRFYYEVAMGKDGTTRITNLMEKGTRIIPEMEVLSDGSRTLEAFKITRQSVNDKVFLSISFDPKAPRPGSISPGQSLQTLGSAPASLADEAPRISPLPIRGAPIVGATLNSFYFAALGFAGFVLKKAYEYGVLNNERRANVLEETAAYAIPGTAVGTGVLIKTAVTSGISAVPSVLLSMFASIAGFAPIVGSVSLATSILGVDPRSDEGQIGIITTSSAIGGTALFAETGGTSIASMAMTSGASFALVRLAFGVGARLAGALLAGVAIGIGLDHGVGQLLKLVDDESTGTWSGDIATRDPWLLAPLVTGPYIGIPIYGAHKLYDWFTEPVNMEVEEYVDETSEEREEVEEVIQSEETKPPLTIYVNEVDGMHPYIMKQEPVLTKEKNPPPEVKEESHPSPYIFIRNIDFLGPVKTNK